MTEQSHIDGNVLGGMFLEIFGVEMTERRGCCAGCGAINPMGSMHVYVDAPGDVLRCPACQAVLMVLTRIDSVVRVNMANLAWVEMVVE
ncbi:MAG TPA: DUF6510 family protein [Acidimicrobiia bacterium]|nr:DUF6510 family protein [Acidimicrobiia bacterium]